MSKNESVASRHYFVDLFAGCGGLSLGLEYAGFHPVFVNELNEDALESYLMNRAEIEPRLRDPEFHCADVKELLVKGRMPRLKRELLEGFGIDVRHGELALVTGGPPCQGFSTIGHRRSYSVERRQLPSNHLFQDMAWVVNQLRPKIFLFENVRGLVTARWHRDGPKGEIWDAVLQAFGSIPGYRIGHGVLLAKAYGVPQRRPRVILVGVREDIDTSPWDELNSGVGNGFLPAPGTTAPDVVDLLGDLVDPGFENGGSTDFYPSSAKTGLQRWFRTKPDGSLARKGTVVTEHDYSKHSPRVLAKFNHMLANGGRIHHAHKTRKFYQQVLPTRWGDSGPTITATSLPDDYVHFSQPRILTVREWARLQGFPDWYQFAGSRTTGGLRRAGNPREGLFSRHLPRYTQIGNAVPVRLAQELGRHFLKVV